MATFIISQVDDDAHDQDQIFVLVEMTATGATAKRSTEVHLPRWALKRVPSRHLIEALGERVNVHVAADDDPDPLGIDEPRAADGCDSGTMHHQCLACPGRPHCRNGWIKPIPR